MRCLKYQLHPAVDPQGAQIEVLFPSILGISSF